MIVEDYRARRRPVNPPGATGYARGLLVAAALALIAAVIAAITLRELRRDASSRPAMTVTPAGEAA